MFPPPCGVLAPIQDRVRSVEAFYVDSPREPGNLGDDVNESREGSGLSFVSLTTETPEDHPGIR